MTTKEKNKTWRIIYPDKTESIMNYDPIKQAEEKTKKIEKKFKEWHNLVVQGLVNGLSHTNMDGRTEKKDFWQKRSILWNEFAMCVQNLMTNQDYKYSEENLKRIAKEGYEK